MRSNRHRRGRGALAVLMAGVAACGSGTPPSADDSSSSPAEACTATGSIAVMAFDLETGAERWHGCGTGWWFELEAVTEDAVYVREVGASNPDLLVFDANSGDPLPGESPFGLDLPDSAVRSSSASTDFLGVELAGGQDEPLVVTDAETGAALWSVPDLLPYDGVLAVGDGAVFLRHAGGSGVAASVRAYELRTGEVRWETTTDTYPWWVADGRVFSIWTDLTVLSTSTGEVLWTTDFGIAAFPGMRSVLATDDTVFVTFASRYGPAD